MAVITSKANSVVRRFSDLTDKKGRSEQGRYLIEGYRSVKDSLGYVSGAELLLSETAFARYGTEFAGQNLLVCSDRVFDAISETASAQGVMCSATIPRPIPDYAADKALLLDRVRDPGNMGTIIRTALAAGFDDIYCVDCVDAFNPKTVRSAMSALTRVNIFPVGIEEARTIKEHGYALISADMDGTNAFSSEFTQKKLCLAIGNEANGLDERIITMSDIVISLPMKGGESLNAAVSASILMYLIGFGK